MSCLSVLLIALKAHVCLVFVLARLKLEKVGLLTKEYESFCPDLVVQGCNPSYGDMEAGEESIKALAVEDLETGLHKLTRGEELGVPQWWSHRLATCEACGQSQECFKSLFHWI